ncbi:MAG: acetyl-CoA carboxylase biotin carboxyl carrier protein [bacterium]
MDELKEIKKLFKLMVQENLYELNVEEPNFKVMIKRKTHNPAVNETMAKEQVYEKDNSALSASSVAPAAPAIEYMKIISPINGIFYRSPTAGSSSFVEIGSIVNKGSTVCIVEAMKLMNEIQADTSCRIVKIMVENAMPVTADQVLFLVEAV